jgi:outer membrane protein assembly factor BamB
MALFLALTIAATAIALPTANAHTPAWTIPTYAYIDVSPNPVGVDQHVLVVFWIDKIPDQGGGIGGDRWQNLTVQVTKPNGDTETLGPYISDPIGGSYASYTPDQVGTYKFKFSFSGQVLSLYNPVNGVPDSAYNAFVNDTYLASNAETTLTVQQEPIQLIPEYPLPTSYWTRPIEGQNTAWASIASNWLGNEPTSTYNVQPYGIAPDSPHIMWTKPLEDGGVVGGNYSGVTYYQGDSYEMRFNNPMVINGRLYYDLPLGSAKTGGGYLAVDLRTGEQLWWQNWTTALPAFGQIFDYESINQHGVLPSGILWRTTGSTWDAYDSLTGSWLFTLTGVPSGTNVYGPNGEITRYVLNSNNKWLALWNNTQDQMGLELSTGTGTNAYQWRPNGKTVDMSTAYSWNVTLPASIPSGSSVYYAIPDDLILCSTATQDMSLGFSAIGTIPYTLYAISLKPATRGTLLWSHTYDPPGGNITRFLGPVDTQNRVFTTLDKETMQWSGYSIDDGSKLWGPVGDNLRAYQYYSSRSGSASSMESIYDGKLYVGGFAGIVYCYDTKNGNLLWTYGNGGEGNSTYSGLENVWGYYPTFLGAFADGKVYTFTEEHSVNMPIYKGATIRCLNATTGDEIWTLPGFAESTSFYSRLGAIADGYLAYFNAYDGQVYCIGKGPSATTVSAPQTVITEGQSVVITGMVTDQSAGAKQKVQDGEFSMVPAMSDASMSEWMQYIYMQKPMPSDATGVEVSLDTLDPNGNFVHIGDAVSDASGAFSYLWTPEVPGKYTVIATFAGTNSYYGSYAETAVGVSEAPTTTPPAQTTTQESPMLTYVLAAVIALIIIVLAIGVLLLRRK